jgi:transposase
MHCYLATFAFPEVVRPKRDSKLDLYASSLQQRWSAGQHNITQLIVELRVQGYRGGTTIVYASLREMKQQLAGANESSNAQTARSPIVPLSAREAAWLFLRDSRHLTFSRYGRWTQDETLGTLYLLVQDVRTMLSRRQA